jgi:hypothetical protein
MMTTPEHFGERIVLNLKELLLKDLSVAIRGPVLFESLDYAETLGAFRHMLHEQDFFFGSEIGWFACCPFEKRIIRTAIASRIVVVLVDVALHLLGQRLFELIFGIRHSSALVFAGSRAVHARKRASPFMCMPFDPTDFTTHGPNFVAVP